MAKPNLMIMSGYPYSGKTTLAKALEHLLKFERITVDEILAELGFPLEGELSEENWTEIFNDAESRLINTLANGRSVIFDATNGHRDYRDKLRSITRPYVKIVVVVFLNTPIETIRERSIKAKDRHKVADADVDETIRDFQIPTSEENTVVIRADYPKEKVIKLIKEKLR